jgi:hypothetical protein
MGDDPAALKVLLGALKRQGYALSDEEQVKLVARARNQISPSGLRPGGLFAVRNSPVVLSNTKFIPAEFA